MSPISANKPRTKAERSMDVLNTRKFALLSKQALTHQERGELQEIERKLQSARRNVAQMRDGTK